MKEPMPLKKRGHIDVLLITVAAVLIISPAYVAGYLESRGRFSLSLTAVLSLAMFLVGAFLIVGLLKE
jgi:hypothetical protein